MVLNMTGPWKLPVVTVFKCKEMNKIKKENQKHLAQHVAQ